MTISVEELLYINILNEAPAPVKDTSSADNQNDDNDTNNDSDSSQDTTDVADDSSSEDDSQDNMDDGSADDQGDDNTDDTSMDDSEDDSTDTTPSSPLDNTDPSSSTAAPLDPSESEQRVLLFDVFNEIMLSFKSMVDFLLKIEIGASEEARLENTIRQLKNKAEADYSLVRSLIVDGQLAVMPINRLKSLADTYNDALKLIEKTLKSVITKNVARRIISSIRDNKDK